MQPQTWFTFPCSKYYTRQNTTHAIIAVFYPLPKNSLINNKKASYLPSSFSSFIIALLNSASSILRLLRLVSWSCFSLFEDFKFCSSSRALNFLFKSFSEAKFLTTTAKRTTTATHKTNKSTFMTKYERCLLACFRFFLVLFHRFKSQNSYFVFLLIFNSLQLIWTSYNDKERKRCAYKFCQNMYKIKHRGLTRKNKNKIKLS